MIIQIIVSILLFASIAQVIDLLTVLLAEARLDGTSWALTTLAIFFLVMFFSAGGIRAWM